MKIRFFTGFSKRENSTKQPPTTAGSYSEYECYLKEDTSIVNPTVILDNSFTLFSANYAYIPDTGRYYFVSDIVAVGKLWSVSMKCDVLATYKSAIGDHSTYLLRCSSEYDGSIIDTYYPTTTSCTTSYTLVEGYLGLSNTDNVDIYEKTKSCFVVGITSQPGKDGNDNYFKGQFGSVQYFALDYQNMCELISQLLDNDLISQNSDYDLSDMSIGLQKSIIDPLQFITSCIWLPIPYTTITSASETNSLHVWDWTISAKNKHIINNPPYFGTGLSFNLTKHPYAATRGSYMNVSPFTNITITIPPFGTFDIDTVLVRDLTSFSAYVYVDLITGSARLICHPGGVTKINVEAQLGVQIQLTQVYNDVIRAGLSGAQHTATATGSLFSFDFGTAAGASVAAIGDAVDAMRPVVSALGGNGGFISLRDRPRIDFQFNTPTADYPAEVGRPLCAVRQPKNLTAGSYILALDGDVPIAGTAGEQAAIKAYMERGMFYE